MPEYAVPEYAIPEYAVLEYAIPEYTIPEYAIPEYAIPDRVRHTVAPSEQLPAQQGGGGSPGLDLGPFVVLVEEVGAQVDGSLEAEAARLVQTALHLRARLHVVQDGAPVVDQVDHVAHRLRRLGTQAAVLHADHHHAMLVRRSDEGRSRLIFGW